MEFGAWRKSPSPSRQLRVLQPQADSLHLQLLPELMGKLPFCFVFFFSFETFLFLRGDKVRPQEEPPRSKECELCVYGKGCKPSSLTLRTS